jgi:asparagine synthase (glutamine-hydrolysing)
MDHLRDDFADPAIRAAPFLWLRHQPGQVESRGLASCQLGTKLDFGRPTPDGVYANWEWDGSRLLAANDRLGFHPLFYFADGETFGISPSLLRLLFEGAPTELDEAALAVFFRTGYFVGEDTPFRAIRALPPSATLEWADGRMRVEGSFPSPEPQPLDRDTAIDAYIDVFREAVRRRLPNSGEYAMPLSGGRDSRHILLQACELGSRPSVCVTVRHYPPRWDEDAELAAQIAGRIRLEHVILDQAESRFRAELRKNLRTGFCSDEGAAFMVMGPYLAGRTKMVFDGLGGDFLSSGRFLTAQRVEQFEAGRLDDLADGLLARQPLVPPLLSDAWRSRLGRARAIDRLRAELSRHVDAPNPMTAFIFFNRARREIALFPFNFYEAITKHCPYLDHDVFDLLMALSPSVVMDQMFHAETVQRAFPALADIPFEPQASPHLRDDRYRRDLALLIEELLGYLDQAPSTLVSTEKARAVLQAHARQQRAPTNFGPHLIYALQLERFIRDLSAVR